MKKNTNKQVGNLIAARTETAMFPAYRMAKHHNTCLRKQWRYQGPCQHQIPSRAQAEGLRWPLSQTSPRKAAGTALGAPSSPRDSPQASLRAELGASGGDPARSGAEDTGGCGAATAAELYWEEKALFTLLAVITFSWTDNKPSIKRSGTKLLTSFYWKQFMQFWRRILLLRISSSFDW